MDIVKKFGLKIRKVRLDNKMSQGKLAKKLSISPAYISQIERGFGNLSLRKIDQLAKALGLSVDKLLK